MPHPSHRSPRSNRRSTYQLVGRSRADRRRTLLLLTVLLLLWSLCLGIGLAQATEPAGTDTIAQASPPPASKIPPVAPAPVPAKTEAAIGTVDRITERYQPGQKLYLENCATCHIGIPPAVLPSETWQQLLPDAQHYGTEIRPLSSPEIQFVWQYLRDYSRPKAAEDPIPYRIYQSQIFRVLHPRVKFTERVTLNSCVSCHPGAGQYDFRKLSAEWQNAP